MMNTNFQQLCKQAEATLSLNDIIAIKSKLKQDIQNQPPPLQTSATAKELNSICLSVDPSMDSYLYGLLKNILITNPNYAKHFEGLA